MTKRLNITLPDGVLARADAFAKANRYSRSGLIAEALEAFVVGGDVVREASEGYGAGAVTASRPRLAIEDIAPLLRAFFSARDEVDAAWVFGSVGRREAGQLSDVDIAVLFVPQLDRAVRSGGLLLLSGRISDVLSVNRVDVVSISDADPVLGHRIVRDGVRVFQRDPSRADDAEAKAVASYMTSAAERRKRHARLAERLGRDGEPR